MGTVHWFRRDLRLADNPALSAALADPGPGGVLPLFMLDAGLWRSAGPRRTAYLAASLRALDASIRAVGGPGLMIHPGPVDRLAADLRALRIRAVYATGEFSPYGVARDRAARSALSGAGIDLRVIDSAYLHAPGSIAKPDGSGYRVFTPFHRAWAATPVEPPHAAPPTWPATITPTDPARGLGGIDALVAEHPGIDLPPAGAAAALRRWREFRDERLSGYPEHRDRPEPDHSSRLSTALHFGEIHPRTIVAESRGMPGADGFVRQLAWRDFYAQVLHERPESAHANLNAAFDAMRWDGGPAAAERFTAWSQGRTGYPFVDAGMRQLLATGWMHNRTRMVAASFLVKDLHIDWRRGASWFMRHLLDADVANNQHGWQWTAGSGTDAAPFHRIFNPVLQGQRFDPDGAYVRRWIAELAHLPGAAAHEPWLGDGGYKQGYPARIVDHGVERAEALARLQEIAVRRV